MGGNGRAHITDGISGTGLRPVKSQAGSLRYRTGMKHTYLTVFTTVAVLCFIAMLAVTAIWMYVPTRIIYQESSRVRTEIYAIEVMEHGHAYFVTPKQKYIIDLIRAYTSVIWFSCFGYLFLFTACGGFARLRLLQRQQDNPAA